MAALIAAAAEPELRAAALELCRAGESVLILGPFVIDGPRPFQACGAAAESAWEDGFVPTLAWRPEAPAPAWLDGADFERVLLLVADLDRVSPLESALLDTLWAAGCDAVDLAPLEAAASLGQSWTSGRRVGRRLLHPA